VGRLSDSQSLIRLSRSPLRPEPELSDAQSIKFSGGETQNAHITPPSSTMSFTSLSACNAEATTLNVSLEAALSALHSATEQLAGAAATAGEEDPCAAVELPSYDKGLHIGAVFIILAVSTLGVLSTMLGKHCPALRLSGFTIALGKAAGTGIVLATALIHMLLPSNESLTSPCVPAEFNTNYTAYAYLFALLAALAMQTLEYTVMRCISARQGRALQDCCSDGAEEAVLPPAASSLRASAGGAYGSCGSACGEEACAEAKQAASLAAPEDVHVGHAHASLSEASSLMSAFMAEFGFTVHSIFIGLAVGVVSDEDLKALLVALCFHQFFEGVSLGARLSEASLSWAWDIAFALLFAVSAPVGIGAGVGMVSSGGLSTNGETFLLVQGTFDGICAGILLHIGFCMLSVELPRDLAVHCDAPKVRWAALKRAALFGVMWGGAGFMALIGKYL
jgi:zinc transporter 1/2/3